MKNRNGSFAFPIFLLVLFLAFTVCLKFVDVKPIGPNNSDIGFAGLNGSVMSYINYSDKLYKASEILGYAGLLLVALFGCLGLYQLIKRRSLFRVDGAILALGVFFVIVLALYVLFNHVVINYRPIIMDGELEPGYPSSHTILAICVFYMSGACLLNITKAPETASIIRNILLALMVIEVLLRFLSGVHWPTDIIGAILLSAALCSAYSATLDFLKVLKQEAAEASQQEEKPAKGKR